MTSARRLALALKLLLFLVGAGTFALLVARTGPGPLWERLRGMGWGFALFLLPSCGIYALDCVGWRLCFLDPPPVGLGRLFLVRMAGESLNQTLPAASMGGEPLKALLLRRFGLPAPVGLASAIVARTGITIAHALFVLSGIAAAVFAGGERRELGPTLLGIAAVTALGSGLLYGFYRSQNYGLGRLLGLVLGKVRLGHSTFLAHRESVERFDEAVRAIWRARRRRLVVAGALFYLSWCLEALELGVFVHLLGLGLTAPTVFAVAALASAAKAAGVLIPGSLGAQEGGYVFLFAAYGLDQVAGMGFSLVRRARELLWIAVGLCVLGAFGLRGGPRRSVDLPAPSSPESLSSAPQEAA